MWGPGMMGGYGWGGMAWMPFMGIFFWLFVLFVVVAAMRGWGSHPMGPGMMGHGMMGHGMERRSPGLDVLEERYARGEIDRDEYLQKTKDIASD